MQGLDWGCGVSQEVGLPDQEHLEKGAHPLDEYWNPPRPARFHGQCAVI